MDIQITNPEAAQLYCREGCGDCCIRGAMIYSAEAINIAERVGKPIIGFASLDSTPDRMQLGGTGSLLQECPFLDSDRRCGIYENRPLVCRTQPYEYKVELNGSVRVTINGTPDKDCTRNCGPPRQVSDEEIVELVTRGLKLKAIDVTGVLAFHSDIRNRRAHELYQAMTLDSAVNRLIEHGITEIRI